MTKNIISAIILLGLTMPVCAQTVNDDIMSVMKGTSAESGIISSQMGSVQEIITTVAGPVSKDTIVVEKEVVREDVRQVPVEKVVEKQVPVQVAAPVSTPAEPSQPTQTKPFTPPTEKGVIRGDYFVFNYTIETDWTKHKIIFKGKITNLVENYKSGMLRVVTALTTDGRSLKGTGFAKDLPHNLPMNVEVVFDIPKDITRQEDVKEIAFLKLNYRGAPGNLPSYGYFSSVDVTYPEDILVEHIELEWK